MYFTIKNKPEVTKNNNVQSNIQVKIYKKNFLCSTKRTRYELFKFIKI